MQPKSRSKDANVQKQVVGFLRQAVNLKNEERKGRCLYYMERGIRHGNELSDLLDYAESLQRFDL